LITKQLYVHNFLGVYIISYSLRSRKNRSTKGR
jgi:hypothetical protein